jgi:uncharacterized protein
MDFLIYSRAVSDSELPEHTAEDEAALNERHWSYMDGFADGMTARGPTLGPGRDTWTGSMHVIDLPGPDAARTFVEGEPYEQAGLFARHSIWRFVDLLGRTMWEFDAVPGRPTYLVLAHGPGPTPVPGERLAERLRDRLVLYGELHLLDDGPAGLALVAQAASRRALETLLADSGLDLGGYTEIEHHNWEFGGRR